MANSGKKNMDKSSDGQQLMRAWHYVMNVIYHNPDAVVKLPSSRALATTLGMARSTVNLAYKKLLKDEFIVCRHGSGTYTNPIRRFNVDSHSVPLVGLSFGESDHFYYTSSSWNMLAALGQSVCALGYNVRLYQDEFAGTQKRNSEFQFSCMDALIACGGLLRTSRQLFKRIPVVEVNSAPDKALPGVELSSQRAAEELLQLCQQQQIRQIAFLQTEYKDDSLLPFMRMLHKLSPEMRLKVLNFTNLDETPREQLEKMLAKDPATLLLHHGRYTGLVQELRRQYPKSHICSWRRPPERLPYDGYCIDFDLQEISQAAATLLQRNLADRQCIDHITVEATLQRWIRH